MARFFVLAVFWSFCSLASGQLIVVDSFLLDKKAAAGYRVIVDSDEQDEWERRFRTYCTSYGCQVDYSRKSKTWYAPQAAPNLRSDTTRTDLAAQFLRLGTQLQLTFWFKADSTYIHANDSSAHTRAQQWIRSYLREGYLEEARMNIAATERTIRQLSAEINRLERGTEKQIEIAEKYNHDDRRRAKSISKRSAETLDKQRQLKEQRLQLLKQEAHLEAILRGERGVSPTKIFRLPDE